MNETPRNDPPATAAPQRQAEEEEPNAGLGLERLVFFSDAVFAIAITLLVLDVKIPEIPDGQEMDQLAGQIRAIIPNILAYFISFMIISVFWVVHHGTFNYIRRYDRRLIWLNLYALLFVAFLPFSAGLLARYGNTAFAFTFYAVHQIIISLLLLLVWLHATRNRRLVDPDLDIAVMRGRLYRSLFPPLVFGLSILVAQFSVNWGFALWFLTALGRRGTYTLSKEPNAFTRRLDRLVFGTR
jgi:uncharacterized membrane protein